MDDKELIGYILGPLGCLVFSIVVNVIQYRDNKYMRARSEAVEKLLLKMIEDGTTAEVALAYTLKPIAKTSARVERLMRYFEVKLPALRVRVTDDDEIEDAG